MTHSTARANDLFHAQANTYTPLDYPELNSAISHINEEHYDELLGFLTAFTTLTLEDLADATVQLTDIYAEAIALQIQTKGTEKTTSAQAHDQTVFIPFITPITQFSDLNTQYILLKQKADKKLGKKTIKLTNQTFVVQDSYKVSQNMLRLELTGLANAANKNPIPVDEAGYAYLFDLAHNATATQSTDDAPPPARAHCYYTLRKAWQTSDGVQAWIDVFLHGDTPGGNWASSLRAGDTVMSKREFPEKIAHLQSGQALLIVDETSIPTVARLLELWDNPMPPLVLCVTQEAADQAYFDEVKMSADNKFTVLPLVTGKVNSGKELAVLIDHTLAEYLSTQPLKIEKVWGALEAGTAKALRGLIQQRLGLERADSVIKVYWRQD